MRKTIQIREGWRFGRAVDPSAAVPVAEGWQEIALPHVWNKENPKEEGPRLYANTLGLPALRDGERVYISFGAVAGRCTAWLNGVRLGVHSGGYSTFRFDMTAAAREGQNELLVLADNTRFDDIIPLGGDFSNYGGIYREVDVIVTPPTHFDPAYYGSEGVELDASSDGRVTLVPHIAGNIKGCEICYTILGGNETISLTVGCGTDPVELTVATPRLWNGRKDPYLYTLKASLLRDGETLDEVELPFGFRNTAIDAEKGFFLNGTHLPVRGVAKHQDWAGVACGTTREMQEKDIALICEMGANAVRLSHYQHPGYTYDLCDRAGLVVWAEIPLLAIPDNNDGLYKNAENQMRELILQNKHHPSICFWGVQNEVAMMGETVQMYGKIDKLNALAKELDPDGISASANLSTVNNDSQLNFITDMVGYNRYSGWYEGEMEDYEAFFDGFHRDNPQVALGLSEYGVDCSVTLHADRPKRKDYSEEFQALFHETVWPMVEKRPYMWGSFVWNMFDFGSSVRDEGGVKGMNCKGLVIYDRSVKKDAFYFYKACWTDAPFVHLAGRRFARRSGETTWIKVYSNAGQVELIVNGRLFKRLEGRRVFLFEDVPLTDEENVIRAVSGSCADEMTITRVDEPEKSYIYIDPNPGFNVKNWFTPGQSEEDLFPQDSYSIMDRMGLLKENEKVWSLLEKLIPQVVGNPRVQVSTNMTLLRAINFMSGQFQEEYIIELNRKLNAISK